MRPYFATSASPDRNSRSDRVRSVSTSATTSRGCENVPTRFLPSGRLTADLPPIAASTCASSVVGTWMNGTPRMYVDGHEAGEIAHRSASQRDHRVVPVRLLRGELMQQRLVHLQRLGRLAFGHDERDRREPRRTQR